MKVCYIISNIDKAIAFEWISNYLPSNNIKLSFILLNSGPSELEDFLNENDISFTRFSATVFHSLPITFIQLFKHFRKTKPDIIHCHLFQATLLGILAGWMLGIKKIVYSRHHSTYNYDYNPKGVYVDRFLNNLATDIVAISQNVQNILIQQEKVTPSKVHLIHHGFNLDAFSSVDGDRMLELKQKFNPHNRGPIIGVIARWIEWKGIQYIIPAFKKLLEDHPNAFLILANANGPHKSEVDKLLGELPKGSYIAIPFENDLFALYQLFDVYVHTPVNPTIEAFGQTYVEALAAGIPSVFTLSGVAPEFIKHHKNALVVPFCDSDAIYECIKRLLNDGMLRNRLISNGRESINKFGLSDMIHKLENLYLS